jgi:protein TonB
MAVASKAEHATVNVLPKPQPVVPHKPEAKLATDEPTDVEAEAEPEAQEQPKPKVPPPPKTKAHTQVLTQEDLRMQIAQLGKQIVQQEEERAESNAEIKSIHSVSTQKYVAAQYIQDWERKVEQIGNLNYPEIARKNNLNGRLTMDVGINADGSIYSMRISKSSGYPELDAAAKKIVKMSAPFAPLPKALLKELKVLVVTRVWSFSDESGLSTH